MSLLQHTCWNFFSPQTPADDGFSPPRPPSHSQNAGTPSTLSTSPGESRGWSSARPSAQGAGDDVSGLKRARTGGVLQPPPPPPPPRFSLPRGDRDRQAPRGSGASAVGQDVGGKGAQSHARRGSHGAEGGVSPGGNPAYGRLGETLSTIFVLAVYGHIPQPTLMCFAWAAGA